MEEEEKKWKEYLATKGDAVGIEDGGFAQDFYDIAKVYFIAGYRVGYGAGAADAGRKVSEEHEN